MLDLNRRQLLALLASLALAPACADDATPASPDVHADTPGGSRFKHIYADPALRDAFLLFLTHVFHLVPEHALHHEIAQACAELETDREIYARIRERFGDIAPLLSSVRFALPALAKQKQVIAEQTAKLVKQRVRAERYVEIGTPGRYVAALREHMHLGDEVYLVHTSEPSLSPSDIVERGGLMDVGSFVPLDDYAPLPDSVIPRGKVDLITNYIGLHHAPRHKLGAFVASIRDALRPGGIFVLRDHDVIDHDRDVFVALAHDVFNAGLDMPWSYNASELRYFRSLAWVETYLTKRGFKRFGDALAQTGDPTHNLLIAFERA